MTMQYYGIKEFTHLSSPLDVHVEELRLNGFTILPDVLDADILKTLRNKTIEIYQLQTAEVRKFGELTEINDANIARALMAYDDVFLEIAVQPVFLELIEKILGQYFILQMQNAIINQPNNKNYQMAWHRDLNYQHFVASRPLAVSILICLDNFSEETGGTCVLPGTHKVEAFPSEQFVSRYEQNIIAEAGSVLVMDSMLYHRAGYNRSAQARLAINNMYCLPFLKQQISLPSMLQGKYAEDQFLNRFLGYDSEPAHSVTEWRWRKFNKCKQSEGIEFIPGQQANTFAK